MKQRALLSVLACLVVLVCSASIAQGLPRGSIVAWGDNAYGQCNVPAPNRDFVAIAAGQYHSLGLKADGTIVAWGDNYYGECNVPAPNADFVAIGTGLNSSMGIKADGTVVGWGQLAGPPPPNSGFVAVAGGGNIPGLYTHSLGLKADGSIVHWGLDMYYCLPCIPPPNAGFTAIACGQLTNLALRSDGTVSYWGNDDPTVPSPNADFVSIASGPTAQHNLCIKADGSMVAWGGVNYYDCWTPPTPNTGWVGASAGYFWSMGLKSDGRVFAWGQNWGGQCSVPEPNDHFIAVSAGLAHGLALRSQPENPVAPQAPTGCITPTHPCVAVPVTIARSSTDNIRGFSVTVALSGNLSLCTPDIEEGSYLNAIAGTQYEVVDNLDGSYTVDCAILGATCGAAAPTGTLFTVNVASSAPSGTGTVTVTDVTLRNCDNGAVAASAGDPASITIDNTVPVAIADLLAAQVKTGNDPDGTTKIHLSFTAPSDAAQVHLYRAGWGNYPEYDDVGGGVPVWPSGSWTLAATLTAPVAAYDDEVAWPARDFWYYVAVVEDACGNLSAVSNQTAGTLNYHLGDVHNGVANCAGDNLVNLLNDIGYLGSNYGVTLGYPDARACLDVGPTTDYSVNARPTTDNKVNFEDLMMFAINYGQVSAPQAALQPVAVASDELSLEGPAQVSVGATFTVSLRLKGAGDLQGLSAQLGWDRAVAEPVAVEAGGLATTQNGVVFSSGAGNVDAALLGANRGFMGEGVLATVTFRALASGAPAVALAKLDARTLGNQPVALAGVKAPVPTATQFAPAMPNPFRGTTTLSYALAQGGVVELAVYSVDGRKVATLASGVQEAGAYRLSWDGAGARPGLYYARLTTPEGKFTRTLVLTR